MQQSVTSNGRTTTTSYIGNYEEVSATSGTTVVTKYYQAGPATVENVGGTYSYLAADAQGSVSVALSSGGAVTASQLFAPYGATRYSSGVMPTSYGFTGQRSDPSGLAYFHARYYDPTVGQFISADSAQGLNRYGYVQGNPTTLTDPSGLSIWGYIDQYASYAETTMTTLMGLVRGGTQTEAQQLKTQAEANAKIWRQQIKSKQKGLVVDSKDAVSFQNDVKALRQTSNELRSTAKVLKNVSDFVSYVGVALDFGFSALDQVTNDNGKYDGATETARAITAGAIHAGIDFGAVAAGAELGATIGSLIPIPFAGTIGGALIGGAAGYIVSSSPVSSVVNNVSDVAVNAVTSITNWLGW